MKYSENPSLFDFYYPRKDPIGLISIPHSGETLPDEFRRYLSADLKSLHEDVDFRVNELIDIEQLRAHGLIIMVSKIIRTAVDLNRSPETAILNWKKNSKGVTLVTSDPHQDIVDRLRDQYYRPYYEMCKSIIHELERKISPVPVIDLHSMPSVPTQYHLNINPQQAKTRPDFCISDQHGKTCELKKLTSLLKKFKDKNYHVLVNDPYIGGHLTVWFDQFKTNNIQIEISRALYMDESKKELIENKVKELRPNLTDLIKSFFN